VPDTQFASAVAAALYQLSIQYATKSAYANKGK
jgi:hypothetical protein